MPDILEENFKKSKAKRKILKVARKARSFTLKETIIRMIAELSHATLGASRQ